MKRVRLGDVADLAGVSMKTVSTVVDNYPHFAPGLRPAAQAAVDEHSYSPHPTPRRLAACEGAPEPVAVFHWGDTAMGSYTTPSLTSVTPRKCGLAEAAIELPGELITGNHGVGRNRVVPHSLCARQGVPDAVCHPGGCRAQGQYE